MPVRVRGLRELSAAFAKADADQKRGLPVVLRRVAEPVRREAEGLAVQEIRRIGERWSRMRTGTTRTLVYVAPRQRSRTPRSSPRRRPTLARLLMTRAMEPALARNETQVAEAFEHALDQLADNFNSGAHR